VSADLAAVGGLVDLASKINDLTRSAERAATTAMQNALKAGELLIVAKAAVPHGGWDEWVRGNCDIAPRTAAAYMRLVKTLPALPEPERQRVADLPVREAVRAIQTSPEAPPRAASIDTFAINSEGRNRTAQTWGKGATALREAARCMTNGATLKSAKITALRSKLNDALAALDALQGGAR
jgi:hypothetical protein